MMMLNLIVEIISAIILVCVTIDAIRNLKKFKRLKKDESSKVIYVTTKTIINAAMFAVIVSIITSGVNVVSSKNEAMAFIWVLITATIVPMLIRKNILGAVIVMKEDNIIFLNPEKTVNIKDIDIVSEEDKMGNLIVSFKIKNGKTYKFRAVDEYELINFKKGMDMYKQLQKSHKDFL